MHPTRRQTCGRSSAASVSASSPLPGSAPAGSRASAGQEPGHSGPKSCPPGQPPSGTLMAWSSLLLSFSSRIFCLPSSSSVPLVSRSMRSRRSLRSRSWGSSGEQGKDLRVAQHPPTRLGRLPGGFQHSPLHPAGRDDTLPSIFLPISWNCFLFFLSSSSSRCRSSTSCCRRRKASASRSALDRNLGCGRKKKAQTWPGPPRTRRPTPATHPVQLPQPGLCGKGGLPLLPSLLPPPQLSSSPAAPPRTGVGPENVGPDR